MWSGFEKWILPLSAGKYYNFQRLSQWDELFSYLLAFVCFLSILKMVHLLRFNRRISMLGCTLKRAAKDLTSFLVVFFFVFVAFFISGYILFGSQLPQYSKMVTSVETLLSVCLGECGCRQCYSGNYSNDDNSYYSRYL